MPHERPFRVLHITESFSAGTGVAVVGFARATRSAGVESALLADDRGSGLLDEDGVRESFVYAELASKGLFGLWRDIGRVVRELNPDVVHLHSSKAGFVGRVRPELFRKTPVIYSPHCFAFERRDINRTQQFAYRSIEKLLARRTTAFVCVSPHEATLAEKLADPASVFVVNNFKKVDPVTAEGAVYERAIVTVGRIAPQKDPAMFLRVVNKLRSDHECRATWIGVGDDVTSTEAVASAGVTVTGWVPAAEVPGRLRGNTVYLHTASWEAGPIAVIDAMAAGVSVVVRRIPAFEGILPLEWQFADEDEAYAMISALDDPAVRADRVRQQFALLDELAKQGAEARLAAVYRSVHTDGR
ncbi:MAG: glycosyltransferase family 4 protein [Nocardiaceae bacterium]|nr:glycosyltransferase family 4 protein [Nocardiaceae bacterium]